MLRSILFFVTIFTADFAVACPYCNSEVGRQVRASVFNDDFWINSLLVISPVPILLAIVALIYFGGAQSKESQNE
jgi:hypothetical protein